MKQHTIPQNIMSVEFKIIGDLSIRQFIYMSIAGGASFLFYLLPMPGIIKYPLIFICVTLGILITFAKVRERPFDAFITSFIVTIFLPTQRVWKKKGEIPLYLKDPVTVQQPTKKNSNKALSERDLNYNKAISYLHSRSLPTDDIKKSNTKLDIEELKLLASIDKAMDSTNRIIPPNIQSQQTFEPINPMESGVIPKSSPFYEEPTTHVPQHQTNTLLSNPMPPVNNTQDNTMQFDPVVHYDPQTAAQPVMPPSTPPNPVQAQPNQTEVSEKTPDPYITLEDAPSLKETEPLIPDDLIPEQQKENEEVITIEPDTVIKLDELKNLSDSGSDAYQLPSTPPNQTNLEQNINASESFMESESIQQIDEQLHEERVQPLQPPLSAVPQEPPYQVPQQSNISNDNPFTLPPIPQQTPIITAVPPVATNMTQTPLQQSALQPNKTEETNEKLNEELLTLQEQIRLLKEELHSVKAQPQAQQQSQPSDIPVSHTLTGEENQRLLGHMPEFIKYPNIISGVIVDSNDKIVEDVVVILKDKSKRIMRAMKSNLLGQFYSRNPLLNGEYDVEANKEGFIFEKVTIDLTGQVVDPLIIRPKRFNSQIESGTTFNLLNS